MLRISALPALLALLAGCAPPPPEGDLFRRTPAPTAVRAAQDAPAEVFRLNAREAATPIHARSLSRSAGGVSGAFDTGPRSFRSAIVITGQPLQAQPRLRAHVASGNDKPEPLRFDNGSAMGMVDQRSVPR